VLEAALMEGVDLPFACKGGVCCTCRARLLTGKVEMDANYALEADELEAGFILTCQSHPRSDKVVIDFDSK
jgi:ring-1,2-phenylacetyl-CoA epoxidase subunit PaaE